MANTLENKVKESVKNKSYQTKQLDARQWLRDKGRTHAKENKARRLARKQTLMSDESKFVPKNSIQVGQMFTYTYDAKHKDTLKYWDMSPVVFPIEITSNGILGINIHYIQPMLRAKLMDALLDIPEDKTDKQKVKLSYEIVMSFASSDLAKPCIHRYLNSHIRGHVVEVPKEDWDYVAFLPLADFRSLTQKVSNSIVYRDSLQKINR